MPRHASSASLPPARLVVRRHRLAPLPAPPLRLDLTPVVDMGRGLAAAMIGLWPVTAIVAVASALLATAGT